MPQTRAETRAQTKERAMERNSVRECFQYTGKGVSFKAYGDDYVKHHDYFKFFDVPCEIRQMICELAVTELGKPFFLDNATPPTLGSVCKQMRNEVLPVFLRANSFHVVLKELDDDTLPYQRHFFNIRPEIQAWLVKVGLHVPMFTTLNIHFGPMNKTQLVIQCKRSGIKLEHEPTCPFCHPDMTLPLVPARYMNNPVVHHIIHLNDQRMSGFKEEHDTSLIYLDREFFRTGHINPKTVALTFEDVLHIERSLNSVESAFALATHTTNIGRLEETPLLIIIKNVKYRLYNN